ncbi:MAG: DEAD/DEAH box helicase [Planctomycetota bacterium]
MSFTYPTDLVRRYFAAWVIRDGDSLPLDPRYIIAPTRIEGGLTAQVSPLHRHRVVALWDGPRAPGACSCDEDSDEGPCEHIWALLRWADRALGRSPARPQAAGPPPDAPEWATRLHRLSESPVVWIEDPWDSIDEVAGELRYQIHADSGPSAEAALTLRVVRRKQLKGGAFGEAKPVAIERDDLRLHDPEDRQLVALLRAACDAAPYSRYSFRARPTGQVALPEALAREVLPRMARTGRLDVMDDDGRMVPLAFDDGQPWRLRLRVARDVERSEASLIGELARPAAGVHADAPPALDAHALHAPHEERLGLSEVLRFFGRVFIVTARGLSRLQVHEGALWMAELWRNGPLTVPLDELSRITDLIRTLPKSLLAEEDAAGAAYTGAPAPHIFIAPLDTDSPAAGARLACRIRFDYGAEGPVAPEDRAPLVKRADGTSVMRDVEAERGRLAEYLRLGGRRTRAEANQGVHGTIAARKLPEVVRGLLALDWSVTAQGRSYVQPGGSRVSVSTGIDWFELEGGLEFGDKLVPFPELLKALKKGAREVALGNGRTGVLPEQWLAEWHLLELADGSSGDKLTFRRNQGWLLDALLAQREADEKEKHQAGQTGSDAAFAAFRARLAAFRGVHVGREPETFQGTLRAYQRQALGWFEFLREMSFGGCLADDMGLGKTVQVLALLESRRTLERAGPSLVVAPRSLIFNWLEEAKRFAPELRVLDYTGPDREQRRLAGVYDLIVTTYGSLRLDAPALAEVPLDYVVLDEATAIKNDHSQAARAVRLLRAEHRLALSGTPVENHIGELWSLFEFLNPGMLGRSTVFRELCSTGGSLEARRKLASALRPFFLRRTKREVLKDLPEKSEQVIACVLSEKERARYDELRDHYRAALASPNAEGPEERPSGRTKAKDPKDTFQMLEALLRLRQAACHPRLLDPKRVNEESAKLEELVPRLQELAEEGHKALVFSQFTTFLALVRARLDKVGVRYEYLDGQTRDRQARVERFQSDPDCPVFLISLKAGGHGLNLTASDYVFLMDPWWNPAVEAQAIDRAHRMGQTRPVMAYRLIAKDTIEERVQELQASKRELAEALFSEGDGALKSLTREDLRALLQ